MVKVEEMTREEIHGLLQQLDYGHLACCRNNRPYLIPVHFAYDVRDIYVFTTEGLKTEIIDENPEVCLQIEEVKDFKNWRSVLVAGRATRLSRDEDLYFTNTFIRDKNPSRIPALREIWTGPKNRRNVPVIYRINLDFMSGRKTIR